MNIKLYIFCIIKKYIQIHIRFRIIIGRKQNISDSYNLMYYTTLTFTEYIDSLIISIYLKTHMEASKPM